MTIRLAVVRVIGVVGLAAAHAATADVICDGFIGPVSIDDTVVVVDDCVLDRTNIDGNLLLEIGGDLTAARIRLSGNVQTDGAERVRIRRSEIGGSIQVEGIYGAARSEVLGTAVGGSLDVSVSSARFLLVQNEVDSDLKANNNTGGVTILRNTVGGNLQCQNNTPPPNGGQNIVEGDKEGQCERL
jgi:hypothetical protein